MCCMLQEEITKLRHSKYVIERTYLLAVLAMFMLVTLWIYQDKSFTDYTTEWRGYRIAASGLLASAVSQGTLVHTSHVNQLVSAAERCTLGCSFQSVWSEYCGRIGVISFDVCNVDDAMGEGCLDSLNVSSARDLAGYFTLLLLAFPECHTIGVGTQVNMLAVVPIVSCICVVCSSGGLLHW